MKKKRCCRTVLVDRGPSYFFFFFCGLCAAQVLHILSSRLPTLFRAEIASIVELLRALIPEHLSEPCHYLIRL